MPTPEQDPLVPLSPGAVPPDSPVDPEAVEAIVVERGDTGSLVDVVLAEPGDLITPVQKAALKRRILSRLERVGDAEAKMKRLAVILDAYPLDAVLGAVPWLGDGIVTTLAVAYTLKQAMKAQLGFSRTAKVLGYHLVDFVAGAVADMGSPLVATIVDYFVKANEWSSDEFEDRLEEFMEEARRQGIPGDEIDAVLADSRRLKETWEKRAEPWRKQREESKGKILDQLGRKALPSVAESAQSSSEPPAPHPEPAKH